MPDYYETLGSLLRDRLGTDEDPFEKAVETRQGKYRSAGNKLERRAPPKKIYTAAEPEKREEPVRVPVPPALIEDFAILRVLPGVPLDYCKKAWKQLLKKYHPDFIAGETARLEATPQTETGSHRGRQSLVQEEAASIVRRINRSYKRIEIWFSTGKVQDYDTL